MIKYYNVTDYAKLRGVTRATIYNWIKSKHLIKGKHYEINNTGNYIFLVQV
jgi:hypothetical protein